MKRKERWEGLRPAKILVVDDDPDVRAVVRAILGDDYALFEAGDAAAGIQAFERNDPDVVLLDLNLGEDADGFAVLERIRGLDAEVPVVILSMYQDPPTIVRAMRAGASHYIAKPPPADELIERVRHALRDRHRAFALESQRMPGEAEIVGCSRAMGEVRSLAEAAARSELPVLILGETGTGKGLVARCIHEWSRRREGPYRDVNVAGLPATVLDSELFGHERGAFTGAERRRRGLFELASGGTILLDEIGDLPAESQVKLLKVVDEGSFHRVGGEEILRTDARVLSATHQDLDSMIVARAFRRDLYHRLAGLVIPIPPLRKRREDIPHLVRAFLGDGSAIASGSIEWLAERSWPGNVRELLQTLKRAQLFARGAPIEIGHLEAGERAPLSVPYGDRGEGLFDLPYEAASKRTMNEFRRAYVEELLKRCDGNVARAARESGISRAHLHVMLRELGLLKVTETKPS